MPLPVNINSINSLVRDRVIESNRIEYKRGWNPERILHSICAFANDIENSGGGYIVVGIDEEDSRPVEVVGIDEKNIGELEKNLFNMCNLVEPRYVPITSVEKIEGKTVFVIWAASGDARPYKCPISIGTDKKHGEKAYYIRRMSHTVRADHAEELQLLTVAGIASYDSLPRRDASLNDVNLDRVKQYLSTVGSTMADSGLAKERVLKSMDLVCGPPEQQHPRNVALMMFADDIERFFPYARIEVVIKPDPTGTDMTEHMFRGPVDFQLRNALTFIQGNVIAEKIYKIEGEAKALRVSNYPYNAVEEILSNAVYHKDYRIGEPVTVTLTPEYLEILSFPGPDPSISDESIENLDMQSIVYRNKRLGDYLKELGLAEGRNTGLPKIKAAMRANGSKMPTYITDAKRTFLRVRIPVNDHFLIKPEPMKTNDEGVRKRRSSNEIREAILKALEAEGCLSTRELYAALGYRSVTSGFKKCLDDMLTEGTICYLYPDKPTHSQQRICLGRRDRLLRDSEDL